MSSNYLHQPISIRTKIVMLIIGVISLSLIVIVYIAVTSAQNAGKTAEILSIQQIGQQVKTTLQELNTRSVRENDQILTQITLDVQLLSQFISGVYDRSSSNDGAPFWPAESHMYLGKDNQYINGPEDLSSVYVPNTERIDIQLIKDIEISGYLDWIYPSVFDNNPNIEAIYFATPNNMVRYYPNINLGKVLPPDFLATERPWYQGSQGANATTKQTWWTPVYLDATGLGLVTTSAISVYNKAGGMIGVLGVDVTLTEMVSNIQQAMIFEGGYNFLMDQSGIAIALPTQGYIDIFSRVPEIDEYGSDLTKSKNEFSRLIDTMVNTNNGIATISIKDRNLLVAYSTIPSTGWILASVVDENIIMQPITDLQNQVDISIRQLIVRQIIPISTILFIVAVMVGLILANRITAPLNGLLTSANKLAAGNWDIQLPVTSNDELGKFADAFKNMAEQIHEMVRSLEDRVNERTKDIKRRVSQLQIALEVVHAVASIRDLDRLLANIAELISERFDFYHVGVFLVDEHNTFAILKAANSVGGQQMLERKHKLKIGEQGIVGFVTASGEPRIALDVGKDAVFFNNPDLPNTRSEMALPLISGKEIVGALDIQSTLESAFDQDDIRVLGGVADMIAIAIQNAQLFKENKDALDAARRAYGEISREAWQTLLHKRQIPGYLATKTNKLISLNDEWNPEITESLEQGVIKLLDNHTLIIPIKIRGTPTGVIRLKKDNSAAEWTGEEIHIVELLAERISTSLETARLYEETNSKAERERLVAEITTKIRSSTNPDEILQTAIRELRSALRASQAQISIINPGENKTPSDMEKQ